MIDPADITLTVAQAKAVVSEAKNRDIYDADMPEDGKVIEVAQEIVGFAVLAWTNDNMQGEDVRVILGLGGFEPDENSDLVQIDPDDVIPDREPDPEPPAEEEKQDDEPAESPAEPEAEAGPEPTPEPESVPADDSDSNEAGDELLEEPWEGFDKLKVAELLKMMSEFTPDQIQYVKDYEAQRNKRTGKKVRSTITDYKAPRSAAEQTEEIAEASQTQQDMNADTDKAVALDDEREKAKESTFDPVSQKTADPEPDPEPEPDEKPVTGLKGVKKHAEHTASDIEAKELALLEQRKRGLPTPPDLDADDIPEMPRDLSQSNLSEIHKLYGQFNAAYATANYALGLAIIEERAYKHIADRLAVVNWRSFDRLNPDTNKPKSQEYLRYEADTADNVYEYRQKENLAAARKVNFSKLVEIYSSNVDVLSRSLTFKEKEIE